MSQTAVVYGASGSQGGAIVRSLRRAGWDVTPISRGGGVDIDDLDALGAVHRDAGAAVVQLPLEFDPEVIDRQVDNIVRAVATARVPRVILNPNARLPPEEIGVPFVDGRVRLARRLRDVASVTVVAPLFAYMENLQIPSSRQRIAGGELAYPVPEEFAMPWVATDDLARAITDALASPAAPADQVVAGPELLRGADAAALLTEALGRPVRWVTVDHEGYAAMLVPHLGTDAGAGIASFYAAPPHAVQLDEVPGLVRGATSLRDWALAQTWD